MDGTWSFLEDAAYAIGEGDVERGRPIVDQLKRSIDTWLIEEFQKSEFRRSMWLLLLGGTATTAIAASALGNNSAASFLLLAALGATVGFWYQKSAYARIVTKVRAGKVAPQPIAEAFRQKFKDYFLSLPSDGRLMFDSNGNPVSPPKDITALDAVWLTGIAEAHPLKMELYGRNDFPVTITRPSKSKHKPKGQPLANSKHHWLLALPKDAFYRRLAEFKKPLPHKQKWMAIVIETAYPLVERHQDWNDQRLLNSVMDKLNGTQENPKGDPEWTKLGDKPDGGTIKKMFYRDRSDPSYKWVREYFEDITMPHKYSDPNQRLLEL
jgi:hypothetical protein